MSWSDKQHAKSLNVDLPSFVLETPYFSSPRKHIGKLPVGLSTWGDSGGALLTADQKVVAVTSYGSKYGSRVRLPNRFKRWFKSLRAPDYYKARSGFAVVTPDFQEYMKKICTEAKAKAEAEEKAAQVNSVAPAA